MAIRRGAGGYIGAARSAGIFPESVAQPTHEFELCLHSGGEMNYVSMDESPFSREVLEQLVASN